MCDEQCASYVKFCLLRKKIKSSEFVTIKQGLIHFSGLCLQIKDVQLTLHIDCAHKGNTHTHTHTHTDTRNYIAHPNNSWNFPLSISS